MRRDLGDEYLADALSEAEADEGLVLTCQMVPSSDCIIAVPVPSSACKVKPAEHGADVEFGRACVRQHDHPEAQARQAGRAGVPSRPVRESRGSRDERASLLLVQFKVGASEASFLIRNVPGGLMSGWLASEARPGARMTFVGPQAASSCAR